MKLLFSIVFICCNSAFGQDTIRPFSFEDWFIPLADSLTDSDGNRYAAQRIGSQIWMVDNLKTTRFSDGTPIPKLQDSAAWIKAQQPAYSQLTFQTLSTGNMLKLYHNLPPQELFVYNYYVIENESSVCPAGWHIPDTTDWLKLERYMRTVNRIYAYCAGTFLPDSTKVLMEVDPNLAWESFHTGFTSKPFGYRSGSTGNFTDYYSFGYWWNASSPDQIAATWANLQNYGLGLDDIHLEKAKHPKQAGLAVKCIKDE